MIGHLELMTLATRFRISGKFCAGTSDLGM
jgi:hypothetical protein